MISVIEIKTMSISISSLQSLSANQTPASLVSSNNQINNENIIYQNYLLIMTQAIEHCSVCNLSVCNYQTISIQLVKKVNFSKNNCLVPYYYIM